MSSKLIYLDLSGNFLNGSLPLSIANLTKIYEFDVSQNKITGILDPRIFPSGGGPAFEVCNILCYRIIWCLEEEFLMR